MPNSIFLSTSSVKQDAFQREQSVSGSEVSRLCAPCHAWVEAKPLTPHLLAGSLCKRGDSPLSACRRALSEAIGRTALRAGTDLGTCFVSDLDVRGSCSPSSLVPGTTCGSDAHTATF